MMEWVETHGYENIAQGFFNLGLGVDERPFIKTNEYFRIVYTVFI